MDKVKNVIASDVQDVIPTAHWSVDSNSDGDIRLLANGEIVALVKGDGCLYVWNSAKRVKGLQCDDDNRIHVIRGI